MPTGPRTGAHDRGSPVRPGRLGWLLIAGIPVTMFALFFFYPVGSLIGRGLIPAGAVDLQGVVDVLGKPRVQRIALFTVWQAAASAAIAVALGLPGAYVLYRCRFRGRTAVRALVTVPFVLPTIVVALAFRTLFAADGPLGWLGLGRLGRGHPRRACLPQLRGGGAHRRSQLGAPGQPAGGGGAQPRRRTGAGVR